MRASTSRSLALAAVLSVTGSAAALAASPLGVWMDHTGRGAVEISNCDGGLCGRVVWVKAAADKEGCNLQIIGGAKPKGNRWDGGWIYDPESKSRYDVELTPVGDRKLRVLGYMGMKMFGETMTWTRAPADLERCDAPPAAAKQETAALVAAQTAPQQEPVAAAAPVVAAPPTAMDTASQAAAEPEAKEPAKPEVQASPAPERATAVQPRETPAAVGKTPPARRDAGLAGLGGIKFEERKIAGKKGKSECTIRIPDLAAFSFDC